jgi:hypothetical protein
MDPIVFFVAAYTGVLLVAAAGLHRLGRIDTSPWRSRVLAGHRRAIGAVPWRERSSADWPHSEVPRLYTGIGAVAAAAAVVLPAGLLVAHHRLPEVAVLGPATVLALWFLGKLMATLRS